MLTEIGEALEPIDGYTGCHRYPLDKRQGDEDVQVRARVAQ